MFLVLLNLIVHFEERTAVAEFENRIFWQIREFTCVLRRGERHDPVVYLVDRAIADNALNGCRLSTPHASA